MSALSASTSNDSRSPGVQTVYSDRIVDKRTGETYFQVGMAIYEEQEAGGLEQNGFASLLFGTDSLQEIVDGALLNPESGVAILDRHGNVVVSAGKWRAYYIRNRCLCTVLYAGYSVRKPYF